MSKFNPQISPLAVETWSTTDEDIHGLHRNEHAIICWNCRVKLTDVLDNYVLRAKLGLRELKVLVHQHRLRWFGHVMRYSDEI